MCTDHIRDVVQSLDRAINTNDRRCLYHDVLKIVVVAVVVYLMSTLSPLQVEEIF